MFCPACNGDLVSQQVLVQRMDMPLYLGVVASCEHCTFISEQSLRGTLIDAGRINISWLDEPLECSPSMMFSSTTLLRGGRIES